MEGGGRREIKVMYTNCQSVVNKRQELRALLCSLNPEIICLTECWTHERIESEALKLENFEMVVRRDREDTTNGRGGGLLIYAREGMCAWEIKTPADICQVGGMGVKTVNGGEVQIYLVYRSPNSVAENDQKMNKWIQTLNGDFMIIGDLNYPGIDWLNGTCQGKGADFLEIVQEKFLSQHVEGGTHISGNKLDLVLASTENLVLEVKKEGRLGASDHEILMCYMNCEMEVARGEKRRRDWGKAEFGKMREELKLDWSIVLAGKGVEETWKEIKTHIVEAMERNIPWKRVGGRGRPRWMSRKILSLISKKKRLWHKCKESGMNSDKVAYKKAVKVLKKEVGKAKKNYEKKVAKEGKACPKQFYAYLKGERGNRVKVGPLKNEEGQLITDPKEQADLLNANYTKVFTVPDDVHLPQLEKMVGDGEELCDIEYTVEKVRKKIEGLRIDAAGGPDGIPPRVLKEIKEEILEALVLLYSRSMDQKSIPEEWRESVVVPIFKGGSKLMPKNYRPVNLTITIMKIKEMIDRDAIVEHIERHELLRPSQHGFSRGRSCVTNLLEFQNCLTKWLDEGSPFDVFYLDFARAFDKVDHRRLMIKVEAFGIHGKLLEWIGEWLRGRRQKVVVEGEESDWAGVVSSVVQGSVLGPLLFLIFINDIDEETRAFLRKFADDTKGAMVVKEEEDAREMQQEINRMVEWASTWRMEFNVDKCKIMHGGNGNLKCKYEMNGQVMGETELEKDLGVLMCSNLKPSDQCAKAAKKANSVLGQIARAFHYRTKEVFGRLFRAFVRPCLEYAASVWCPWTDADCDALEKVQRRAVRMICDVKGSTYEEKLKDAKLMLLKERRMRGDLIEVFKVMKGISKVDKNNWFDMVTPEQRETRQNTVVNEEGERERREWVIKKERFRLEVRKNFFTVRVVDAWNNLPATVKNASNVNMFKSRIDAFAKNNSLGVSH